MCALGALLRFPAALLLRSAAPPLLLRSAAPPLLRRSALLCRPAALLHRSASAPLLPCCSAALLCRSVLPLMLLSMSPGDPRRPRRQVGCRLDVPCSARSASALPLLCSPPRLCSLCYVLPLCSASLLLPLRSALWGLRSTRAGGTRGRGGTRCHPAGVV
jgi:hypothetical protein